MGLPPMNYLALSRTAGSFMLKINKLETGLFSSLLFISKSRRCTSHALLCFPSSMVDAKQTIRDMSLLGGGGGSKEKTGNHVYKFINMNCTNMPHEMND
jgi:hypothetical protein